MEQGGGVFKHKGCSLQACDLLPATLQPGKGLNTHLQPLLCTQSSSHCLETGGSEALTRNPKQLNNTIYLLKQN